MKSPNSSSSHSPGRMDNSRSPLTSGGRYPSEADTDNRKRDFDRIVQKGGRGRPAQGCEYQVTTLDGVKVANGFVRLLLGDHGPYVEMDNHQINKNELRLHGRGNWFGSYFTKYGTKLYHQTRAVRDVPNPPQSGKWFKNHNRKDGYAGYIVGKWYVAADEVKVERVSTYGRHW
jgi:hypothetical protein